MENVGITEFHVEFRPGESLFLYLMGQKEEGVVFQKGLNSTTFIAKNKDDESWNSKS